MSKNVASASKNLLGASKDLPSTSVESIDPPLYTPPQWGSRVVYDDIGRKQLVGCKCGEPDDEPPIKRITSTSPLLRSDTDVDIDSDSDEGDSSLLLGNDDVVQVSGSPSLFVDINLPVHMADAGLA